MDRVVSTKRTVIREELEVANSIASFIFLSSQGNRQGGRAEQFFADVPGIPAHGSHGVRDLEEKATKTGQGKPRSADGRGQGCKPSDRRVPTSVS